MRSWRWYSKVLFALLVAAFAYWVWPTAWFYPPLSSTIARVHRVTGEVQRTRDGYWERVIPPRARVETEAEHQTRVSAFAELDALSKAKTKSKGSAFDELDALSRAAGRARRD
jgi:hypothetical protein